MFVTKFKQILTDTLQENDIAVTRAHYCPPDTEVEAVHAFAGELKREGATVMVASSHKLAINAIHALHSPPLPVPDDCALTGFGAVPAAPSAQPTLTNDPV